MKNEITRMSTLVGILTASMWTLSFAEDQENTPVSCPGSYSVSSEPVYADDYDLSSQYVEMRDGTKIAVDICRPKDKETGEVVETPLPVLWMHTPYNRRYNGTKDKMTVDCYAGTASKLIKYGYVVATADFRGLYASYGLNQGFNRGEWISAARNNAYDITEWLAVQPWSNGNIGMWGCSATGGSQMQAATTAPPHLKAMFPMSFEFDVYDFRVTGGIPKPSRWSVKEGDPLPHEVRDAMAAPVDEDVDGSMLAEGMAEHEGTIENVGYVPFRDSYSTELLDEDSRQWWMISSPSNYIDAINESGIAMYMAVNWDEGATKPGPFYAINNFTVPRKLIIGPGVHCDWETSKKLTGFDVLTEELRFFDYWLKGIDNGIMDEDSIYYFTYNAPKGEEWNSTEVWPLKEEKRQQFFLGNGKLNKEKPEGNNSSDQVVVDYAAASVHERGPAGVLLYHTMPLEEDIQITGHPTINLWVSSTATDGDFVATIEDVAPNGTVSSYNVWGQLRASHRKLSDAPYDKLGLPYHSFTEADVMPLIPGKPTELEFELLPISMIFKAGHQIRLKIGFVARGTHELDPAPRVTVYRDSEHPSHLTLPIIPSL